ncbi:hypothetical protein RI367_002566 [Sorochytrium milnesiophthora]
MASGYGIQGGRPRCFMLWQEFQKCYLTSEDPRQTCVPHKDDYFECLHRTKEIARNRIIAARGNELAAAKREHDLKLQREGKALSASAVAKSAASPAEK